MKYKHEFKDVNKAELDKYIQTSEYCKEKKVLLDQLNALGEMLKEFASDFHVKLEGNFMGFLGLKYEIQGAGYADLILLLFNCITSHQRDRYADYIVSDFKDSNNQGDDAMMGDAMMGDAMM